MKPLSKNFQIVVIISSDTEWRITKDLLQPDILKLSPYGEFFTVEIEINSIKTSILIFHGGWGKIWAAGATQYIIDKWSPELLVNLGTCGGFRGEIEKGTIILVNKTIVYDIIEQMTDPDESIAYYTTDIDLSWLKEPYPQSVYKTSMLSGDRDLVAQDIPFLKSKYNGIAVDWESGAIAWIAQKNKKKCLILRGVTDLVGDNAGDAYDGNYHVFKENSAKVLKNLFDYLPQWISNAPAAN